MKAFLARTKSIMRLRLIFTNVLQYVFKVITFQRSPRQIWSRLHPKLYWTLHSKSIQREFLSDFKGKSGITVGGSIRGEAQKYLDKANVVNVDSIPDFYGQATNADYLTDASNLYFANDGQYDFVCSSHVLEHLTNPIKALKEWMRVINDDGVICCVVPDKRFNPDHKRKRTTLEHLISDYERDVGAFDATHLSDILQNTDLRMEHYSKEYYSKYVSSYLTSKAGTGQPHHHVFTLEDVKALFKYVGLKAPALLIGDSIHVIGRKA